MMTKHVQLSADEHAVVSVFACAQDADAYPNYAEIDDADPRYLAYVNPSSTLQGAQAAQIALVESSYLTAIQQPVNYMGATFQADQVSQGILAKCLVAGAVPAGMFWLDANNTQVPMTYAQLQGLAGALLLQGQVAFTKKTMLKEQIRAADTVAAAQAIVW